MILMTVRVIKILSFCAAIFGGLYFLRGKIIKKNLIYYLIVNIAFAVFANMVAGAIPQKTDRVTLTVLGEQQEEATDTEVWLQGYTIDKKPYVARESLKITDGYWFWIGDAYCWIQKADLNQEEEATRTISIEIPVGWERTLDFKSSKLQSMVEISIGNESWIEDTYEEANETHHAEIGRSSTSSLILNGMREIAVYLVVLLILVMIELFIMKSLCLQKTSRLEYIQRNWDIAVYILLSIFTFIFLQKIDPNSEHFYYDQVVTLGHMLEESIGDTIEHFASVSNVAPPLNAIIMHFWLKVASHTIRSVCAIPNIYIALAIFLFGLFGRKIIGKVSALFTVSIAATSLPLLENGNDLRDYSLVILAVVCGVFGFAADRQLGRNIKRDIYYGLSLAFLAYSNYHAIVLCFAFFILDILLFRKKLRFKILIPYVFAGILYLPWLITVAVKLKDRVSGWAGTATWHLPLSAENVTAILKKIAGDSSPIYVILLICSISVVIVRYIYDSKVSFVSWEDKNLVWNIAAFGFLFFLAVLFGNAFINPDNTLLQFRYFSACIPLAVFLQAAFLKEVIQNILIRFNINLKVGYAVALVSILCFGFLHTQVLLLDESATQENFWLKTAQYLSSQRDIYAADTAIVLSNNPVYDEHEKAALEFFMYEKRYTPKAKFLVLQADDLQYLQYSKIYLVDGNSSAKNVLDKAGYEYIERNYNVDTYSLN